MTRKSANPTRNLMTGDCNGCDNRDVVVEPLKLDPRAIGLPKHPTDPDELVFYLCWACAADVEDPKPVPDARNEGAFDLEDFGREI